ncbi:uncharacterized protein G2W53_009853 [Senna tora]|uniref:Uncharacterized protein n=1 Tax=Senna tora TaxID=362788 RepID=A0A834WZ40_9FABA|nr:uncharacterized protein G2W53_009853 [Senna tora]
MIRLESSWHGRSVDHVLTYSGQQITVGSQKHSRITRQKTCCASESNTSVRVVFANWSGVDALIGLVLAWEERGSCLNIFRTTNRGRISETFTNYEAKDLLRTSGFVAPIGIFLAWEERGSCLKIFRTTNRARISGTFTNYEAKDLLRKNLHELRGKRLVAQVSQTRWFANRSGFDGPIGVVLAWEERGSCLNIFRTTNRGRISETFTNYEAKSLLRKHLLELRGKRLVGQVSQTRRFGLYSRTGVVLMLQLESSWHGRSVDHVSTYSGRQIAVGSQKSSRITRQKTCCASESNSSVRVVFANGSGFDAPIGVVLAWEERGSCLNIFRTKNRGWISETFTNYEGKDLLRKRQIAVGSQKPSRITRQKTCCASESNTSVRVVFASGSGFDVPIGVVLAWEERGSCLNIFRTTNRGRISETFTNYEAKDLLRKRKIAVGSQKPSRITRQNTCCACESNTSVRVVFANRSGFDAPIGVVLAWEERGSCLNIFRTTNCGRISETFANYEAKDLLRKVVLAWEERGSCLNLFRMTNHGRISETFPNYEAKDLLRKRDKHVDSSWHGRSVDHVLTYSGRQIAVGSQKPSRIMRQKTCCASESNTSVGVVFANRSGFDAPIGVVLAWEERGSCLNIFRTTNRGRISETFTNFVAKDLLRKNLHELRGKRVVAQVSQTRRFANRSGFDAPIGVVFAWEERGSCLNIFRITNRSRISETFTNYEAKDLLHKNLHELLGKRLVAQMSQTRRLVNRSGFDAPIGVVLAWEERGSCLNIFRLTNRDRISETFMNYEAKDLLRK